ncbi:unnamed protein product, partial [marine sediment metagenome]
MKMTDAIRGYMVAKTADGYAGSTMQVYNSRLKMLAGWLDNPDVEKIVTQDLR